VQRHARPVPPGVQERPPLAASSSWVGATLVEPQARSGARVRCVYGGTDARSTEAEGRGSYISQTRPARALRPGRDKPCRVGPAVEVRLAEAGSRRPWAERPAGPDPMKLVEGTREGCRGGGVECGLPLAALWLSVAAAVAGAQGRVRRVRRGLGPGAGAGAGPDRPRAIPLQWRDRRRSRRWSRRNDRAGSAAAKGSRGTGPTSNLAGPCSELLEPLVLVPLPEGSAQRSGKWSQGPSALCR
jgi:hypothetical protein